MSNGKFTRANVKASKLEPQQVVEIYRRRAAGETQGALARDFQISIGQIGKICRGEVWQELYRRFTEGLPLQPKELDMHFALQGLNQERLVGEELKQAARASLEKTLELLGQGQARAVGEMEQEPTGEGWNKLQQEIEKKKVEEEGKINAGELLKGL